jgi:hypothetical protein
VAQHVPVADDERDLDVQLAASTALFIPSRRIRKLFSIHSMRAKKTFASASTC